MTDDDEWQQSFLDAAKQDDMPFHEICKWSPYKEDTIDKIADSIVRKGYDETQPVVTYEGAILDGRHRYVAAQKVGVDPIMVEFHGTRQEAIDFVRMRQIDRGHWSDQEIEYFYAKLAEVLGVRERGAPEGNQNRSGKEVSNPTNVGIVPSAKDHADSLGVTSRTIERWEKDRKEIMSDPELAKKAETFEGYKEAKKEVKERRARMPIVPEYNVNEAMGAIKGIAQMFGQRYKGTTEDAAQVLLDRIMEGYDKDDVGLSIAKDYAKWFLSLKKVFDLAGPEVENFLADKPNLTVVK